MTTAQVGLQNKTVQKRSQPWTAFNVVAILTGIGIGMVLLVSLNNITLAAFSLATGALVGWPVRDAGSPHAWLMKRYRMRAVTAKKDGAGTLPDTPLSAKRKTKNPWDQIQMVLASVRNPDGTVGVIPLFHTLDNDHLTVVLTTGGMSDQLAKAEGTDAFLQGMVWREGVAAALSSTNEPDVDFIVTWMSGGTDETRYFDLAHLRGRDPVFTAANTPVSDLVTDEQQANATIGQVILATQGAVMKSSAQPTHFVAVRMLWPRKRLRKIDLSNPAAFKASALWKTLKGVLGALKDQGFDVRFADAATANGICTRLLHSGSLQSYDTWGQRDRNDVRYGRTASPRNTPSGNMATWKPTEESTAMPRSEDPEEQWPDGGALCIDSTWHIAGFAHRVNRPYVEPDFSKRFVIPPNTSYAVSLYIKTIPMKTHRRNTREAERMRRVIKDLDSRNAHLSNPEKDKAIAEVIASRQDVADALGRAGDGHLVFSVSSDSRMSAQMAWDELLEAVKDVYMLKPLMHPDHIRDALQAQLGMNTGRK